MTCTSLNWGSKLLIAALLIAGLSADSLTAAETLKVFVLAGQSNMQGHGKVKADPKANGGQGSLEWLVKESPKKVDFKHLVTDSGDWVSRDDVQIWYLGRQGKLTAGYGASEEMMGPELGFGHVVGNAIDEPVLLVKLAWGGKSLGQDFRPPSSGGTVGPYYQEIITQTKTVLKDLPKLFPEYASHQAEIVGFGWHQGWNDRINQAFNDEYEKNLANLVRDLRKDLSAPNMKFVVAETGMTGPTETHPRALSLMKAQAAVAEYEEFRGNVAFVGTRDFYRPKEESPSGQGYHWNSNAETYYLIGDGMGHAMLKLLKPASK